MVGLPGLLGFPRCRCQINNDDIVCSFMYTPLYLVFACDLVSELAFKRLMADVTNNERKRTKRIGTLKKAKIRL